MSFLTLGSACSSHRHPPSGLLLVQGAVCPRAGSSLPYRTARTCKPGLLRQHGGAGAERAAVHRGAHSQQNPATTVNKSLKK